MLYKASGFWNKSCERSLRWDDPQLAIAWPLGSCWYEQPLLAEKDAAAPSLIGCGIYRRSFLMKVLLTGSAGQLGQALLASKPKHVELIPTSRGGGQDQLALDLADLRCLPRHSA